MVSVWLLSDPMLRILLFDTFVTPVWDRKWLWALYLSTWVLSWLLHDSLNVLQILFFLFGLVVFTIPHGASDLHIPAWILNPPWENRVSYWILSIGLFTILGAFTWALSTISINFVIALFTGLIIWHWGSMDTIHIYPNRGPAWVIGSVGRGLLVMIAPLYFRPLETQEIILGLINAEQSHILRTLYSYSKYLIILAIILELTAFLANKFIEGNGLPRTMAAHAMESLLLLLTFKLADPVIGLTFYFLILHSIRHMARAVDYIPEGRSHILDGGGLLKTLPNLFQRTNLVTFLAGFILAGWFAWQLKSGSSFHEASLGCLLPIILLMIPHTLISLMTDFNPKRSDI
jgi:Brp/Blh family beta-carotene 15,15'-monooxygenase